MGAGKWRPEYCETLHSADVVIIGDNDEPGSRHVEQVAAALHGIAKRVRVLDLAKHWPQCPHKGDISDWLAAGGSTDRLMQVIVLRQKTRRLFLLNLLTQYGHLGSILAIATIKR
jgi:putative DNA primase/helicase